MTPAVALVAILWPTAAFARPTLDSARLHQLGQRHVLVFSDPFRDGLRRGKAIAVIDATPEEVFRVATDYAKYREFLPRVSDSTVLRRAPASAEVDLSIELPWPVGRTEIDTNYRHEKLPGGIYRVTFNMIRGDMKRYHGSIYIEPWSPGRSAITYELLAQPRSILATTSLVNRGVRGSTAAFVKSLRQRIDYLHRLGWLHPLEQAMAQPRLDTVPTTPDALKARR